ncbi:MAG: hypothetical protein HY892_10935 [Deltaproteobacteria bacterium]|nr:hypothetical protein [Deltaproteobacteria bacterium]
MKRLGKRKNLLFIGLVLVCFGVYTENPASALLLKPQNVQAMAVYGINTNYGIGLLSSINFDITDPPTIAELINAIDFSVERDCSTMLAQSSAYVYLKFTDGTIEVYDLFGLWSHISKAGLRGSCYFVSETGQNLYENKSQ